MRLTKFLCGLTAMALTALAFPATAQVLQANPGYVANSMFDGVADLSNTSYTNATTTATILTGTGITVPATSFDPAKQLYTACFTADVTKATSTTGSITVAVGGVPIAASARYASSAAGRTSISGCYSWVRSSAAAQVVSLYAVSADTASFAVQNAQLRLERRIFN